MAMHDIELPSRIPAKELLAKLGDMNRLRFQSALLDALWTANEAGTLPAPIVELIRDWTAGAYFENDPVTQARLAALRILNAETPT